MKGTWRQRKMTLGKNKLRITQIKAFGNVSKHSLILTTIIIGNWILYKCGTVCNFSVEAYNFLIYVFVIFLMLLLGHCFGVNLLGCLEEGQCRHSQSELCSNGSIYSHSILRASSLRWVSLGLCAVAKCCRVWATLSFLILTSYDFP